MSVYHPPNTVNIGNGGTLGAIGAINTTGTNIMWDGTNITTAVMPTTEYHIKGEMIGVSKSIDFTHRMNSPVDDDVYKDNIKKELVEMLVNELWKTKHVEFTMTRDQSSFHDIYRARICTVPDTQVRILRERGLPK